MPMCGWCGALAPGLQEFNNGASPLRLCPQCARSESARDLRPAPAILDFELNGEVWQEAAPSKTPGWIQITALLVLIAFLAPVGLALLSRL